MEITLVYLIYLFHFNKNMMEIYSSEKKLKHCVTSSFFASREIIVKKGIFFSSVVTVVYYLYNDKKINF